MCRAGSYFCERRVSGRHGPNGRANYFSIHATVMGRYIDERFVLRDGLTVEHI